MADKGLVMDLPYGEQTYYLLVPGLIGFMEFTFMRRRARLTSEVSMPELARLMSDYLHENGRAGQAGEFFGSPTQLTRALVYREHVPVESRITDYEDARRIIEHADYCAVTLCYCRHKKEHLGEPCRKGAPVEDICMVLGEGARFLVRRGFAKELDKAAMLAKLEQAHALGLTHVTDNIREQPSFVCNCCRCCCELMAGVQMGFADGIAKAPFLAEIDPQRCDYCGECMKACNVKCIGLATDARSRPRSRTLCWYRSAGLPWLRCLHQCLRARCHPLGAAAQPGDTAADQGPDVRSHPVGKGAALAVRRGPCESRLADTDTPSAS